MTSQSMPGHRPRVVVVGGGLAGLSAAISCVDGGAAVTLVEARPRFGGATWSFDRKGLDYDNGQHVYLRCCTAYQWFLERIGSAHLAPMRGPLALPVLAPPGPGQTSPVLSWLRRGILPAPAHLTRSLATYRHLSLADRARIGRAGLALRKLDLDDPGLDTETFGSFLTRHGQSEVAIDVFWDLIGLPTTNLRAREVSLAVAAKVFKTLLEDASAGDIAWSNVPLFDLHANPAVQLLERSGADVRSKAKVSAIELDSAVAQLDPTRSPIEQGSCPRAVSVVTAEGRLEADAVVVAVAHNDAAELVPPECGLDNKALASLGFSPIIDIHVVYDRVVMPFAIAAGVHTPVQYVFDRTSSSGMDPKDGQCLAVSVSGADVEHGEKPDVLIERYTTALRELFPAARSARIIDSVVTREHEATFRASPGTQRLRPGVTTKCPNLFIAGAWTDTKWPATMEGAVRSGISAAAAALSAVGHELSADQIGEGVLT